MVDATAEEYSTRYLFDNMGTDLRRSPSAHYKETITNFHAVLTDGARIIRIRNQIIIDRIGRSITSTLNDHPELKNQDDVLASMTLGALHVGTYDQLVANEHTAPKVAGSSWAQTGRLFAAPSNKMIYEYFSFGTATPESLIGFLILRGVERTMPSQAVSLFKQMGSDAVSYFEQLGIRVSEQIRETDDDQIVVLANKALIGTLSREESELFVTLFDDLLKSPHSIDV
jgi:hypothetical protein